VLLESFFVKQLDLYRTKDKTGYLSKRLERASIYLVSRHVTRCNDLVRCLLFKFTHYRPVMCDLLSLQIALMIIF